MLSNLLKNKLVLITGASSGIGTACARAFAAQGARLLLCARRLERLEQLAQQLHSEFGTQAYCFPLDITHYDQVKTSLDKIPVAYQAIDILVNNAGLARGLAPIHESEIQDWEDMINTNIKGLLYVTRKILPQMVARNSGHIINIGSVAGHHVYPKGAVYCATKFAVNALSQGLRMDLFGTKIRVTSIDPGAVETEFSIVRFDDKARADAFYEDFEPLTPEDVADAVIYSAQCPPHVNVSEMILMSTDQAAMTMIHRNKK